MRKKKTNATFGIHKEELVQVALLQIHAGDGAYLSVLLGSLIGASSMHFCLSYISRTPQRMGNRSGFSCAKLSISMHFSSVQPIRVANHDILNLVGSDR